MNKRKGEKIGWIGGWLGAFLWLLVLSIIMLVRGDTMPGIIAFLMFIVAVLVISLLTPWRFPNTKYWIVLLPPYIVFLISAFTCIMFFGGLETIGLKWTNFLWFVALLRPFFTIGAKTWNEGQSEKSEKD